MADWIYQGVYYRLLELDPEGHNFPFGRNCKIGQIGETRLKV